MVGSAMTNFSGVINMNRATLVVSTTASAVLGLAALSVAHANDDIDNTILRAVGEFEVGSGEVHSIAHHKTDKEYRICVRKARHAVPLKVMYDGKESTVAAGSCADFEAMNIKVAPGGKLDKDTVLIGKFHQLH